MNGCIWPVSHDKEAVFGAMGFHTYSVINCLAPIFLSLPPCAHMWSHVYMTNCFLVKNMELCQGLRSKT